MREIAAAILRVLTLRIRPSDVERFDWRHLLVGLLCVWLAGVGRHWDDPDAELWRRSGLFSVLYAIALTALLYVCALPLRLRNRSFRALFTFVAFTAPPAWLYAVPVEMVMSPAYARGWNASFLLTVATWRVMAYVAWLMSIQGFRPWVAVVSVALPIACIIAALSAFAMTHATFDGMGGYRTEPTPNEAAYIWIEILSFLAIASMPIWVIAYGFAIIWRREDEKRERTAALREEVKQRRESAAARRFD